MSISPFFSVIVPAYNSEGYIGRLLDSIIYQTFTDYELIVVCDSCTDHTADVAVKYGARIFETSYHRDGLTRNVGLNNAVGEWILFADDDDWFLHEYTFEQLAGMVGKHNEDVLCFSYITRNFGYIRQLPDNGVSPCVWSKCWNRSFVSDIRFSTRKYWSDTDFHNKALRKPHKYAYWDMPIYYYNRQREGSQSEYAEAHKEDHLSNKPVVISLTDPAIHGKG